MGAAAPATAAATTVGAVARAPPLPKRLGRELSPVASIAFGGDFSAMADVYIQWWGWSYGNQIDRIYELICDC